MLVLAADTSGKEGSIALLRALADGSCETIDVVPLEGGTFSAELVPQIASLLKTNGFKKEDIAGFVVASGPGSFTGLRVGLAAVKGLAEVLEKPIAAVSLLETIAAGSGAKGRVLAVLDAGRSEVYVGEYELVGEQMQFAAERLLSREQLEVAAALAMIVTSDEKIASFAQDMGLKVQLVSRPQADSIARLGWRKIIAGETVSPEELEANYIRRTDAEIFAKGKS
jgi:tRNA threonylcarbamoyladenosine biosynthesis protein TsaB